MQVYTKRGGSSFGVNLHMHIYFRIRVELFQFQLTQILYGGIGKTTVFNVIIHILIVIKKKVSMIRKYHNHTLQTNPPHSKEELQTTYRNNTSVRQL